MFKKLMAITVAMVMLATLFAGCGAKEEPMNDTTEKAAAETKNDGAKEEVEQAVAEEITLTYAMPQSQYKDVMRSLIERYQTEFPNVTIDIQAIPDAQFDDLMQTKLNLEEAPDLITTDKRKRSNWGVDKFVVFENEDWQARLIDGVDEYEKGAKDGGELRTLIFQGPALEGGILYNTKMFEKYGLEPPKTMDEFYAVSEVFKADGIIPLYASDKDLWTIQIFAASACAQFMTDEDYELINSNQMKWADVPELADALDTMANLRLNGYTNEDFLAATYDSALGIMAEEKAAMYVMGTWFIADVANANPDVELGYTAIPFMEDVAGAFPGRGGLSIWKGSENVDQAKHFVNWFSQPENFNEFQLSWGFYPAFVDQNLQMPEWQTKVYDDYIASGKISYTITNSNVLPGTIMGEYFSIQQEILVGLVDGKGALEKWDIEYAMQAKNTGVEAFQ